MANTIEWGQGAVNNNNDWGKAKANSTNGFGAVYDSSLSGDTNIVGGQPVVSITYSSSSFCADASDPTPTIRNNAGAGTFSSTSGLVFISTSTGEVDIDASTAGSYLITYTDTDSSTATFNLTINSLPTANITGALSFCAGSSTVLTATSASSYLWSTGQTTRELTVTSGGSYSVTITDSNGCSATSSIVTVTEHPLPNVEITGTLTYCAGNTTTLTAPAGLSSYLWSTGATTQSINVTAGTYTVTGTDANGCSATSSASTVTELPLDSATVTYSSSAYCQMPTGALAVDGYYPLYTTASAANAVSNDGQSHTHYLSGQTYYMPGASAGVNPGVVLYHGGYSLTTPAPSITGETGTFSESTGNLSIDSSTGVINVNNSTAGTYTVVYTTNGSCPNTVNNTITINPLDGASFAYSASSLPQTGTASLTTTPTTSGGVYSAYPSGLSINSSTGEIDLAASTIQSYKIFYITSGTCPNSSTFNLAVTAAGITNNFSMSFDGINDYIDLNSLDQSILNGSFTVSFWLNKTSKTGGLADNDRIIDFTVSSSTSLQIITDDTTNKFGVNFIQNGNNHINQKVFNNWNTVTGSWHHIALTWNGSSYEYYFDGSPVSTTGVKSIGINGSGFYLGKRADGFSSTYLNGKLDEVAIWNTALTSTQVQSIYDGTGTNLTKDLTTVSGSNLIYWNRMGD
ncbi:MAG: putative concanavalin A-like lectin/glucanases superfamily protein [Prokaryotic dsDNA virus sp.]|nr:MAG: putative concanavalin A-like lectin/glucanases superfamily protein [Prokaryotic dsDNA virus sp.]